MSSHQSPLSLRAGSGSFSGSEDGSDDSEGGGKKHSSKDKKDKHSSKEEKRNRHLGEEKRRCARQYPDLTQHSDDFADPKSKPVEATMNQLRRTRSVLLLLPLLQLLRKRRNAAVSSKATKTNPRVMMNLQVAAHE